MKKKKVVIDKIFDVRPVEIKCGGRAYDYRWRTSNPVTEGYQLFINFKGNIMPLVSDDVLTSEYGLLPKNSRIICRIYSEKQNITHVRYVFDDSLLVSGEKRATAFKEKIKRQMVNPVDNQIKTAADKIVPFSVSQTPIPRYTDGKKIGYRVSVKFDGQWESYPPSMLKRFEYAPFGAKVLDFDYDFAEHTTDVDYVFRPGMFGRGEERAWKFIDKINARIKANNQSQKQFYIPVSIGDCEYRYDGAVHELILPVNFGDIFPQVKIADVCVPKDVQAEIGIKQIPNPELRTAYTMTQNASNQDYIVRYHFHGTAFKDAFADMNAFRAKLLSVMTKDKVK